MNTMYGEDTLRRLLEALRRQGAVGLKAGLEAEGQDLDDLLRMSSMSAELPLTVKIGGPEAVTDLRMLLDWGIHSFVAPMIETPFAVKKSVHNLWDRRPELRGVVKIGLNLESVAAFRQRHEILGCPEAKHVTKINVGRTDLAASLDLPVESPAVTEMTREFVRVGRAAGKVTGVGGTLVPRTIASVLRTCDPEQFETRHVVFETARSADPAAAVGVALEFERALVDWLDAPRRRVIAHGIKRQEAIEARLRQQAAELRPVSLGEAAVHQPGAE
jgi:hypothetical protein